MGNVAVVAWDRKAEHWCSMNVDIGMTVGAKYKVVEAANPVHSIPDGNLVGCSNFA